jgi:hypothetical protein
MALQLDEGQTWFAHVPEPGHIAGHFNVPPQPSPMSPQYCPPSGVVQEIFLHEGPPVQIPWVASQVQPGPALAQSSPQERTPPQPSPTMPQYLPPLAVVH